MPAIDIINLFWEADFSQFEIKFENMFKNKPICENIWFESWLDHIIRNCLSFCNRALEKRNEPPIEKLTMSEMFRFSGRHLKIVTISATRKKSTVIDHISYPNMSLKRAILCSTCLPYLFPKSIYKDESFWDGGLAKNYPIDLGDVSKTLGIHCGLRGKPMNFLNDIPIPKMLNFVKTFLSEVMSVMSTVINENECNLLKGKQLMEIELDTAEIGNVLFFEQI